MMNMMTVMNTMMGEMILNITTNMIMGIMVNMIMSTLTMKKTITFMVILSMMINVIVYEERSNEIRCHPIVMTSDCVCGHCRSTSTSQT